MTDNRTAVIVTGVSGNLGTRLLPLLAHRFKIVGVDMRPPETDSELQFEAMDLGREAACDDMVRLLRETGAKAIVHLAFVIDPLRTGVLDVDRMWQINVAGTARVMEAIAVVNRHGGDVRKFIFPSSVSAYGPETPGPVTEDHKLGAHTLPYAIHKQESDEVVRHRAPWLGQCSTFVLRPHIFSGATVQNYLIGALRGSPLGRGKWGERMRQKGTRLPLLLPYGDEYLQKRFQFVHVDDMARLMNFILRREDKGSEMVVLNVAGRGEPITITRCAEIANQKLVRLPKWMCRRVLQYLWDHGASSIPPEALPYMIGSYTMDTTRLRRFLGQEYETTIRYTVEDALADSFAEPAASVAVSS